MVWFYPRSSRKGDNALLGFQSHYGLILSYRYGNNGGAVQETDFQSHYGLILSKAFKPCRVIK